mmetsp:Transcript_19637/g.41038  ORF Transcript_19637/g.41038 Transcript_19637/m.41038 type:complete len:599 (+) Transcript_19637:322-2118(+)|eukprot:CAMPEP_0118632102 /NCGR_PEP_ID=MMETSP0785-20121206/260_1 /TAXON_ID=91992 /ORGANISM="Bolidomonas pacifica, Strain CCMP 1866" /LENGTH=598 /DNA_ID=CAMNT_0006522839 /DNA_START=322 /DNA_END=2118 /DNA_ORIENTATION=+
MAQGNQSERSSSSHRRRSSIIDVVVAQAVAAQESLSKAIKDYIAETAIIAIVAAILPMLVVLCLRLTINETADKYYGEDRIRVPPILISSNTTVVPFELSSQRWKFSVPVGKLLPWQVWWNWFVAFLLYGMYYVRVVMLPKTTNPGRSAGFLVSVGFMVAHGYLWMKEYEYQAEQGIWSKNVDINVIIPCNIMIAVAFPTIFATVYFVSEGLGGTTMMKGLKVSLTLFLVGILESLCIFVVNSTIIYRFFSPGTSNVLRFFIRLGTPLILKGVFLEVCSVCAPFVSNLLESDLRIVSIALFGPVGCAADLIARLMQSSSLSVKQSIILELGGAFAEVFTADVLLQGHTNLDEFRASVTYVLGKGGCMNVHEESTNKVAPDTVAKPRRATNVTERRTTKDPPRIGAMKTSLGLAPSISGLERKQYQRTVFCATAMMINTITEASGLIVGSLLWIGCNANPSTMSKGAIDTNKAILNLAIMLFGELVLSDSAVAYMSHRFASRYCISIAHEWEDFRSEKRRKIVAIVVLVSFMSSAIIMQIPNTLCYTSQMSDEDDWALMACPNWSGLHDHTRVDERIEREWEYFLRHDNGTYWDFEWEW